MLSLLLILNVFLDYGLQCCVGLLPDPPVQVRGQLAVHAGPEGQDRQHLVLRRNRAQIQELLQSKGFTFN